MKKILIIFGIILLSGGLLWLASYEKRDKTMDNQEKNQEQEEKSVRQPAVAGQFYPSDKNELAGMIERFLEQVEEVESDSNIRGVIAPHAGYVYSGGVAACGFKAIQNQDIDKVILIGSSHNFYLDKAAIDGHDAWQTPLGQVEIDSDLRDKLINNSLFEINSEAHQPEHSLEVEVPFLQTVLKGFKLLPILVSSSISSDDLEKISQALGEYIDKRTLIVVSTDMSHYPEYDQANQVDGKVIEAILSGQVSNVRETINQLMGQGISNLDTCLCGQAAVEMLMNIAGDKAEIKLLNYANSGDVSVGDRNRVVGYGAISFAWQTKSIDKIEFNQEQKDKLLEIAKESVEEYVKEKKAPSFSVSDELLNKHLGVFVTLKKHSQLRGCIGRFAPDIPLYQVVSQMAISAAVKDARFKPVQLDELDELDYEVSVLSPLRKIDSWQEIELGKHGVQIKKGLRSGVFLPQVATENNWDLDKFMGELCSQKAGLDWVCWKTGEVDIYVFTANVFGED